MVKVSIISGFLGAGKTTLIKKLVKEAFTGEKVILIENEYGEIGIDGGFMKDSGIEVSEINSGCICCTLVGDFHKAIDELLSRYSPDRLVIEPSGVGKLSEVRAIVEQAKERHPLELDGCATVVDGQKCRMYLKNFGEFFIDQVRSAETVLLSRTQLMSQEKLDQAVTLLREQNADARIVTTPWDDIDGKVILEAIEHPSSLIDIFALYPEAGQQHEDEDDEHEHHHDDDDDEHEHHHHDEDDEHEHHHHDDDDEHEHHHHDDDDEHEHHHDDDDEHEHHHHDDDDEHEHHHDDDEHEHHHDDDNDEHEHHHHDEHGHHHHHHHHHHGDEHDADEVFDTFGLETAHKFTVEGLETALKALSDEKFGSVLRAKGIVPGEDGRWIHFDFVPEEHEIRYGSADYTGRLCVIGVGLKEDEIKALFGV